MKALVHLMRQEEEPRVQAHAASAVVNFCEHLDGNIMGLYLDRLTQRFQGLLGSSNQLVVEGGLTALSSVTDSSGVRRCAPAMHKYCSTVEVAWRAACLERRRTSMPLSHV
jgi:hypothetical protein